MMGVSVKQRCLEKTNIADVRRLAIELNLPIMVLLEASLSVTQHSVNSDVESRRDFAQGSNFDVAFTV